MSDRRTPPRGDSDGERIHEVRLGDAFGDDQRLRESLPRLAEEIANDAPGTSGYVATELLKLTKTVFVRSIGMTVKAIEWGVRKFTDAETRRIIAEAEAHKTRVIADAEATKIVSEAQINLAEASKTSAVAEATRADTARKDLLIAELKKRGIDWAVDLDEKTGVLRVAFTKKKPE